MSFIKKQTVGSMGTLITLILAVISVVIYFVNIGSEGYFQGASVSSTMLFFILAIVMLVIVFAVSQIPFKGGVLKIVNLLLGVLRVAVPACLIAALLFLLSGRVEGFAFIYFSNEEVLQEVQTAANLSSSHLAIANLITLAITAVCGMISTFFNLRKEA